MEEFFSTKIKISLTRSLFSKTESEDLGINLVWSKLGNPYDYQTINVKFITIMNIISLTL